MKKVLGVSALTLIAACLIAPKFIATKYETTVTDIVANINKEKGYSATIESTESSWFGSKSKVLLSFDLNSIDPTMQSQIVSAEFTLDTHYGPLLLSDQGKIGLFSTNIQLQGEKQREYLVWDEKSPLYNAAIVSNLFGKISFADKIPAFKDKNNEFSVTEYAGKGTIGHDKTIYNGGFKSAKMDITEATTIQDLSIALNLKADWDTIQRGGFYDADMSFKVGKVVRVPQGEMNGLAVTVHTKLDKKQQLGNIQMSYSAKNIDVANFKAHDLKLVTEINHLDNQIFIDYAKLIKESDALPVDQQVAFFLNNMQSIIDGKPELNITELSGSTKDGHFTASMTSKLADMATKPTGAQLYNPKFWLYNAIIDANIEADQTLVTRAVVQYAAKQMPASATSEDIQKQSTMLLDSFVNQGLIKISDDKYISTFHAEKGQGHVYDLIIPLM